MFGRRAVDQRVCACLAHAEREGTCLVPRERWLREALARRVRAGLVVRPMRGMYALASTWQRLRPDERHLWMARGLQVMHPAWVFCRETAAVAWGLPVSFRQLGTVRVATRWRARRSRSGDVAWHQLAVEDVVVVAGLRVTSLVRTTFDCLRHMSFRDGLAVADAALRVGRTTVPRMRSGFRRVRGRSRRARRALGIMSYADARSESWAESAARAGCLLQGFATPLLQVRLPRPDDPTRTYRADLAWQRADGSWVLGEVHGMEKYLNPRMLAGRTSVQALADEQHRASQLSLYRMPVLDLSYDDVVDARRLVARLERYGIPRDRRMPHDVARLARANPCAALAFAVVGTRPEVASPGEVARRVLADRALLG